MFIRIVLYTFGLIITIMPQVSTILRKTNRSCCSSYNSFHLANKSLSCT